jgi:hypothetical protein
MTKKFLRSVVVVAIIAASGSAGAWFVLAGNAVRHAEQWIADTNDVAHQEGSDFSLRYVSIERAPFPHIGVRLVNPEIVFAAPKTDAEDDAMVEAKWQRKGTVDFITDHLRHEYRLISDGTGEFTLRSGEDETHIVVSQGHIEASLRASSRAAFAAWGSMDWKDSQAVQAAARTIARARVQMSPITMTDTASEEVIFTQQQGLFLLINRSAGGGTAFELTVLAKGSQATPAYGDVALRMAAMIGLPALADMPQTPFSITRAGKQDVDIVLQVDLPPTKDGAPVSNGSIRVPRFVFTNDYYSLQLPTEVVLSDADGHGQAHIRLNWSAEVKPAGAKEMQRSVGMSDTIAPLLAQLSGSETSDVDPEALQQKILAALPTLSTLGPIRLVTDIDAEVTRPPEPNTATANIPQVEASEKVTIRKLEFGHARWGMDAKGMAARDDKGSATVDLSVLCKQCETLTQDGYDGAQSLQALLNLMNPNREQWLLEDAILANLNEALAQIGRKDAATGDISFAVGTPSPNDIRINDTPIAEVMKTLTQALALDPKDAEPSPPAADTKP